MAAQGMALFSLRISFGEGRRFVQFIRICDDRKHAPRRECGVRRPLLDQPVISRVEAGELGSYE